MPRSLSNYDSLAYGMDAIMNDDAHKSVFEQPVVKTASHQEEEKKEEKGPEVHPIHSVLERLVEASSTLDSMGLNKSAAEILRAADLILAEATGEAKEEDEDAEDEQSADDMPGQMPAPMPGHLAPGEGKPLPMPAGDEKPAENEKPGQDPAQPMSAEDGEAEHDEKKDKEQKALEVVEDLINMQHPQDLGPSEWKDPTPDSDVEPITVVPGK